MNIQDLSSLKNWFIATRRELPWRESISPYGVWVSEIMLQQTQVAVVIPYFERWMKQFPSLKSLAEASLDDVIKAWEGLGYYSRARNLHQGAQYVVATHAGELPSTSEELSKIKGLGPYTVGAILNFAFHQKAEAVDGNVLRVLSRYYKITEEISKSSTVKEIRKKTLDLLPDTEPWVISEALIELGATVCSRNPKCKECPLKNNCIAYLEGIPDQLPKKSAPTSITNLYRAVPIIFHGDHVLVSRGIKGGIMADLYEFPYFEIDLEMSTRKGQSAKSSHRSSKIRESTIEIQSLIQKVNDKFGLEITWKDALTEVKHSFTRYRALLLPHLFETVQITHLIDGYEWKSLDSLKNLSFSSGHRQILQIILSLSN